MEVKEILINLFFAIIVILVFIGIIKSCAEENTIIELGKVNGYSLIQLQDGHQYLRSNGLYDHSLTHYPECPKCIKEAK